MWFYEENSVVSPDQEKAMMARLLQQARRRFTPDIRRALILPPDLTRYHSGAGRLSNDLYHLLGPDCRTDLMPTLGQHVPHTSQENRWMFGDIPEDRILVHDWRGPKNDRLGEVPAEFIRYATGGRADWPLPVEINGAVTRGGYDLIVNIGQVVPHEVLGFANHNKNYFIGLGSKDMICASHMMAAMCGIEDNLGQIITPLRACYNVAERDYLSNLPHVYVLVIKTRDEKGQLVTTGFYVGDDLETYVRAARYAREHTVILFDKPLPKVVCHMDHREFHSTWVANKAVYRTRKVVADGGELIVIAPGVDRFGEQDEVDRMIRRYGYKGTPNTLEAYKRDAELRDLGHAAAHLIHGSSEGRFRITYAPGKVTRQEVESIGFNYLDTQTALQRYNPEKLHEGLNSIDGEEFYYISSPSLGLWTARDKYLASLKRNVEFACRMEEKYPDPLWSQLRQWNQQDYDRFSR